MKETTPVIIPVTAPIIKTEAEISKVEIPVEPVKAVETPKIVSNIDVSSTKVTDVVMFGNCDSFQLLCKASSKSENWMKSTKAYQINGVGCVIQVTTQQGLNISEALCFVPGASIVDDVNGGRKLVKSE